MAVHPRDPTRLYTDAASIILQIVKGPGAEQVDVADYIQPVMLVGRNIATKQQSLDGIIDSSSRLKVSSTLPISAAATGFGGTGDVPGAVIDDYADGAGNADQSIAMAAVAGGSTVFYELLAILVSMACDATVATRTVIADILTGFRLATGVFAIRAGWASSTLTLTASQGGSILWTPGSQTQNDNGTITVADAPEAIYVRDGFDLAANQTTGQAGDDLAINVIARRVA